MVFGEVRCLQCFRRFWRRWRHAAVLRPCVTVFLATSIGLVLTFVVFTSTSNSTVSKASNSEASKITNDHYHIKTKLAFYQKDIPRNSSSLLPKICNNVSLTARQFPVSDDVLQQNRVRLRRQLPAWRRVVLMITFLNPTFSNMETLNFLYTRFFGRVAYCISSRHVAKWKSTASKSAFQKHWLLTYNGYDQSKDDRSYECWVKIRQRIAALPAYEKRLTKNAGHHNGSNRSNHGGLVGILSIMDDVLLNLWNFGINHRGGRLSSMMSKVWSMTDGALFVPSADVYAKPFFIGDVIPSRRAFKAIGDHRSFKPVSKAYQLTTGTANATLCSRQPSACNQKQKNEQVRWYHWSRFYNSAISALADLKNSSEIRQTGNASLAELLEKTAIYNSCWNYLHSQALSVFQARASKTFVDASGKKTKNQPLVLPSWAAVVGEIPADVLYMPLHGLDSTISLLTVFRRHSLHAEIAVPTAVACLVNRMNTTEAFVPLADDGMQWSAARLKPWQFYQPALPLPLIHPVKFAQIDKDDSLRAFLCQKVFPSYNV